MTEQLRSADLLVTKALASTEILDALKTKPEETLKSLAKETVQQMAPAILPPDSYTSNAIWLIVICSFALVMVGAAYVLGIGVTTKLETGSTYASKSDTILTVFTTVVAFLAGLLSPSPIKK